MLSDFDFRIVTDPSPGLHPRYICTSGWKRSPCRVLVSGWDSADVGLEDRDSTVRDSGS